MHSAPSTKERTTLLALETSCDETGVAIVRKEGTHCEVLSSGLASQIDIHKETGGVVPEIAAREHIQVLRPLINDVMGTSGITSNELDAIAVTIGPGLPPALAVGVTAAQTLAYAWKKPLVPVNHLEGHIYSALLTQQKQTNQYLEEQNLFPALALIVSGGHTLLVLIKDHLQYEILGTTRDDAAGEAFDKAARLLGLPYPGGPALSALARAGNTTAYDFPRPMIHDESLDFSFSGLKTAVYYTVRDHAELSEENKANIAASFEQAVIDTLIAKTSAALERNTVKQLLLAGGVAANHKLRAGVKKLVQEHSLTVHIAPQELCGDNAQMIGLVGLYAYEAERTTTWEHIQFIPRLSLTALKQASD